MTDDVRLGPEGDLKWRRRNKKEEVKITCLSARMELAPDQKGNIITGYFVYAPTITDIDEKIYLRAKHRWPQIYNRLNRKAHLSAYFLLLIQNFKVEKSYFKKEDIYRLLFEHALV